MLESEEITHIRAGWAKQFDAIIDALVETISRHPSTPAHDSGELHTTLDGILTGLIAFSLQPDDSQTSSNSTASMLGAMLSDLTDHSEAAYIAVNDVLFAAFHRPIPNERRDLHHAMNRVLMRVSYAFAMTNAAQPLTFAQVRTNTEAALRDERTDLFYQRVFADAPIGISVVDVESGQIVGFNAAMTRLFGFTAEEEALLTADDFRTPETPPPVFDLLADLLAGRIPILVHDSVRPHRDGHPVYYRHISWLTTSTQSGSPFLIQAFLPITQEEFRERRQALATRRIRYLSRLSIDPLILIADNGLIRFAAPSVDSALGYDPDALVGTPAIDLIHPDDRHLMLAMFRRLIRRPFSTDRVEVRIVSADGRADWYDIRSSNLLDEPDVQGVSMQARDISDRRLLEAELIRQAALDPLTSSLNRRGLTERLDTILAGSAPAHRVIRVIYLDLDDFKTINDTHGHAAGDGVLVHIAQRLRNGVGEHGWVGRMGGDEFVVILYGATERELDATWSRVITTLWDDVFVDGTMIPIGGSFGIATRSPHLQTERDLMRAADRALYHAKAQRGLIAPPSVG